MRSNVRYYLMKKGRKVVGLLPANDTKATKESCVNGPGRLKDLNLTYCSQP
jgi:hypothetical protein